MGGGVWIRLYGEPAQWEDESSAGERSDWRWSGCVIVLRLYVFIAYFLV